MPTLVDPVVINGRISGAYRDEPGFQVEGQGIVGLTDLLTYLLDGGGEGDGNGIYSGSGTVPDFTVATCAGDFTIRHDNDGNLAFGDTLGIEQSYIFKENRELGFRNLNASNETDLVVNPTNIILESNLSAPDPSVGQITVSASLVKLRSISAGNNEVILEVTGKTVRLTNIPNYADDAAADADGSLLSDSVYTTTGNRSLKIKP